MAKPTEIPEDKPLPSTKEIVEQRKLRLAAKEKDMRDASRKRLAEAEEASKGEPPVEEDKPPVEEDKPPVEEDKPPVEEDKPPVEDDDDDFEDFEEEDDKPPVEDDDDDKPPVEDEEAKTEDAADIKAWRERVKEQGKARKDAEARTIELEGNVENLEETVRTLEEKNKEISSANINWNAHTSVKPMWEKFDGIVDKGARTFSDAPTARQFRQDSQSELLTEYHGKVAGAKNADERLEADIAYKGELAERYDVEDGGPLLDSVRAAVDAYIEITEKTDELKKLHEEGRLAVGVSQYNDQVKPFTELFDDMGNVDEEFITTNPASVEAVVGKRYAEDKEFHVKADKFKERVKQFVFGLRPLSQDELDKAEKRATTKGLTVPEYLEAREQNYEKARSKFLNDVFFHGMAIEEFPQMRKIYDRYQSRKRSKDATRKNISKGKTPPKKDETPNDDKVVKASDRPYIPPSKREFAKRD